MTSREKILVYRLGSLGDTIVALPCFHKIAEAFPDADRILLTNIPVSTKAAPLQAVLGDNGLIHRYISYPTGTRSLAELWKLSQTIRAMGVDTLVYLMPARGRTKIVRDRYFFRLSGVGRIIGLPTTPDLQANRIDPKTGAEERECERLARTLFELGPIDLASAASWDLLLTAQERQKGEEIVAGIKASPIALNMGGKAAEKDWGIERWLELLKRLSASFGDHPLLIVGAAEDSERAQQVGQAWPGTVIDACGRLSPRESAAALRSAKLFIGHDSGPLHLAAAIGVSCVGLFGNFNKPMKWHPYGAGHRIIHDMAGMAAISINEVLDAALSLLSQSESEPASSTIAR
ncbi:glycosyltransferase family 9 protein [Bradyrhizobium sp. NC92]|uniref:glycosyltransferase family 9 protein n=1 Tax=Bradyrhizobium sp. (strain NC92) TaxID=55395 RepID=UPI0021AAFECF|nr:glycosyltransferase family 9 protein [Bradyrhizobium sp. NC92]UWU67621.1 glycosyltransferase family 9 protein [Bradyrhizobium sp. NC92]